MLETFDTKYKVDNFLKTEKFNEKFPSISVFDKKYGFIYKITNLENGKIYIGKANDIRRRAVNYIGYPNVNYKFKRGILPKEISRLGIDKFIMEPIDYSISQEDLRQLELKYISDFNSTNPEIGYNTKIESNIYPSFSRGSTCRNQYAKERIGRSKLIVAINMLSNSMIFSTGMKLFGDVIINRSKDVIKSTAKRCGVIEKYFIMYIKKSDFQYQKNLIINKKRS